MKIPERGLPERKVFADPETGREIWQLTDSAMADRHAYYDACPWSNDGRAIVFSSAFPEDLTDTIPGRFGDLRSTNRGGVYQMDTQTFEIRKLAEGAYYQTHNGAFAIWSPDSTSVFFRLSPDRVGMVAVDTLDVTEMDGGLRSLSHDGNLFAFNNPGELWTMDADGSNSRRIANREQIRDVHPMRDALRLEDLRLTNPKWHPSDEWLLLADDPRPAFNLRSLYVMRPDGSEKRWLCHFGHHHSWTPDGRSVLFAGFRMCSADGSKQTDPRLFLIDIDGSNRRMVIDEPLGGHPLMHPSGELVVTSNAHGVILVHIKEQRTEYLATFGQGFRGDHGGTHPHCVWNQDGTQVLYNSAQNGHSQLFVVPMAQVEGAVGMVSGDERHLG